MTDALRAQIEQVIQKYVAWRDCEVWSDAMKHGSSFDAEMKARWERFQVFCSEMDALTALLGVSSGSEETARLRQERDAHPYAEPETAYFPDHCPHPDREGLTCRQCAILAIRTALSRAEALAAQLAAVQTYLQHKDDCECVRPRQFFGVTLGEGGRCTCGLRAALLPVSLAKDETQ